MRLSQSALVSVIELNELKVTQSCPTLCTPMDYTVHGILQATIVEWVAYPFSSDLPNQGIDPGSPALQEDSLPTQLSGKPLMCKFIHMCVYRYMYVYKCSVHIYNCPLICGYLSICCFLSSCAYFLKSIFIGKPKFPTKCFAMF